MFKEEIIKEKSLSIDEIIEQQSPSISSKKRNYEEISVEPIEEPANPENQKQSGSNVHISENNVVNKDENEEKNIQDNGNENKQENQALSSSSNKFL